eukprot:6325172-Amphidinium_carterae.2
MWSLSHVCENTAKLATAVCGVLHPEMHQANHVLKGSGSESDASCPQWHPVGRQEAKIAV